MFGLFKRKTQASAIKALTEKFLGPVAMAVAVGQTAREHLAAVSAGEAAAPIHRAQGASALTIWHHLRLEAFAQALDFGEGSLVDLADAAKQKAVLRELLDRKVHLQLPQPSGSAEAQSVQSMWQVYCYLSHVGSEVCDPLTDRHMLSVRGRDILSDLEADARSLLSCWDEVPSQSGSNLPSTLFEAFFADVNRKSKSIALATAFGPDYENEIPRALEEVVQRGGDATTARRKIDALLMSGTPDEAAERMAAIT